MFRLANYKGILAKHASLTRCLAATTTHHRQASGVIRSRPYHIGLYEQLNSSNHDIANNCEGWMGDAHPAHYTLSIESFSKLLEVLSKFGKEKHESGDFEVGGYKWRLSVYPNGDKKRNVSDHISLYLTLSETNTLPLNSEVNVVYKLFMYDQLQDKYLTVQEKNQNGARFHAMKRECGFSNFIPLSTFLDPTKGYLINDRCVFGAEVYVRSNTGKGESFSVLTQPQHDFFSYSVDANSDECSKSEVFEVGGHNWCIHTYPNGTDSHEGKSLSIFLNLEDISDLQPGQKLYCEYIFRLKDQVRGDHHEGTGRCMFSAEDDNDGILNFLPLSEVNDRIRGFMVKDQSNLFDSTETLIIEAKITLLSQVTSF